MFLGLKTPAKYKLKTCVWCTHKNMNKTAFCSKHYKELFGRAPIGDKRWKVGLFSLIFLFLFLWKPTLSYASAYYDFGGDGSGCFTYTSFTGACSDAHFLNNSSGNTGNVLTSSLGSSNWWVCNGDYSTCTDTGISGTNNNTVCWNTTTQTVTIKQGNTTNGTYDASVKTYTTSGTYANTNCLGTVDYIANPTPTPTPSPTPSPTPEPNDVTESWMADQHYSGGSYQSGSTNELYYLDDITHTWSTGTYFYGYSSDWADDGHVLFALSDPSNGLTFLPENTAWTSLDVRFAAGGTAVVLISLYDNGQFVHQIASLQYINSAITDNIYNIQDSDMGYIMNNSYNWPKSSGQLGQSWSLQIVVVSGSVNVDDVTLRYHRTGVPVGGVVVNPICPILSSCTLLDPTCYISYYLSPQCINTMAITNLQYLLLAKAPFAYISSALAFDVTPIIEASSSPTFSVPLFPSNFSAQLASNNLLRVYAEPISHLPTQVSYTVPDWLNNLAQDIKLAITVALGFFFVVYIILMGRRLLQ